MKNIKLSAVSLFVLSAFAFSTAGQTNSIWHRQAFGQTNYCPSRPGVVFYWANNNNWSQAQVIGDPCSEGDSLVEQPSNWSTPEAPNGVGYNVTLGSLGGAPANLDRAVALNRLTIQGDGGLNMQWGSSLTANTIELQGDNGITLGGGGGATPAITLASGSYLIKSGGAGINLMGVPVYAYGGIFQINSGTLSLSTGGGGSNATFMVSSGSILDLTGGSGPTWSGQLTGSGAGQVRLSSGSISAGAGGLALNFPDNFFQWIGGTLVSVSNAGNITVSAGSGVGIAGQFNNRGTLSFSATASLNQPYGSGFNNLIGGSIDFQNDASITMGGGSGGTPYLNNWGLIHKSGGTNTTTIATPFSNLGGTVQVDSGSLSTHRRRQQFQRHVCRGQWSGV